MIEQNTTIWLEWMKSLAERYNIPLIDLLTMANEDAANEMFERNSGLKEWEQKNFPNKANEENN